MFSKIRYSYALQISEQKGENLSNSRQMRRHFAANFILSAQSGYGQT